MLKRTCSLLVILSYSVVRDLNKKITSSGSRGVKGATPPPKSIKNSHKKMATKRRGLYFMFLGPPSPKFMDPLLIYTAVKKRLHRGNLKLIYDQTYFLWVVLLKIKQDNFNINLCSNKHIVGWLLFIQIEFLCFM